VTGIGKTVNYTRKLEGDVGELAKKLVTRWKDMVAEADKVEEKKPPVPLFSKI
jgi:TFIIS helical bundle-like domain